ncbi:acyl-CoA-binding domain-containing protein 5 [Thamnophis elegans]|uniref:acyl-CoA-binding domain-containing protein 5 n=1 Tax=Thamnophis elegans TaxID=35005 RepID=UPI001377C6A4|nr:acyl-CoA-binding domain-containing protein 5 [Thamnophis elegans]XP_032093676.1 acyl-CoA-binding domain-containing protein 5 [Thamnophis elegans]XP_032093677.1 acyl-CoA-binding domain-containing protein 5 [Thamnophis elegans]XP_032093678.1 acyl-CoA-binding domain-containing protein 5 [Thamnophis elegans]
MAETENGGDSSVHETRFEAAVKVIQSLPKNGSFQPTNEMMLKFYSFYKQATQGPCNIPRPGFWDPIGRYKWDAWSSLGTMPKEDAMIAYVEEMKKILETMPMTDKVEELLHVLGPFYEIVEDKKNKGSDLITDLHKAVPAVNGKSENNDSGAESEDEPQPEELRDVQQIDKGPSEEEEDVKQNSSPDKDLDGVVINGSCNAVSNIDINNGLQSKSNLNGINVDDEIQISEKCLELPVIPNWDSTHQDQNEDTIEVSGIQLLTSDSDSEIYCDSMEQFVQEEILEISSSVKEISRNPLTFSEVDYNNLLETSGFLELGNHKAEGIKEAATEGKGEIKCGGEDGKGNDGGPQKEKKNGEKVNFYGVRRGRGHRMYPLGDGGQGGQMGSGGDGERWGSDRGPRGTLNEQIAIVLIRLQEDMQNILQRLHALEALTTSQATLQPNNQPEAPVKKPSWWPFEISPGTLTFAVLWPFVTQWLVHLYLQRRRRKQN